MGWKNEATVQVDFDLGQARPIGFGQAWMLRRDADGIIQASSVKLDGSNDGSSWTELGSTTPALSDNTAAWVEVTATVLGEWRYARLEVAVDTSGAGDQYCFLGELQVYGDSFPLPQSASGATDAGASLLTLHHMNEVSTSANEPDYSGNGLTMTASSNPPATTGVFGGARRSIYELSTTKRFANTATGTIAWGTGLTWMLWISIPGSLPGTAAYRRAIETYSNLHWLGWNVSGTGAPALWQGRLNNTTAASVDSPAEQGSLATTTWYHLAMTYDGSSVRLYVNGNLVAVKAYTTAAGSTTRLFMGGDNSNFYLPDADLDEVMTFTRTLSEAEIRWHAMHRRNLVS